MAFTAFISDLHLTEARPHINEIFFRFLNDVAPSAQALYILGDLFEFWIGDDDLTDPLNARVAAALARLSASGVKVSVMHGNRDFLLMGRFCRAAAAHLIIDPTVVDCHGVRTLLMHGDTLCTDDLRYQAFRQRVRSPIWQKIFLAQPLWLRRYEVRGTRRISEQEKEVKSAISMDVTPQAVEQALREYRCNRLIHGHTHRPARHVHVVDGETCERWVLSDWYKHGQYLHVDQQGCRSVELQ